MSWLSLPRQNLPRWLCVLDAQKPIVQRLALNEGASVISHAHQSALPLARMLLTVHRWSDIVIRVRADERKLRSMFQVLLCSASFPRRSRAGAHSHHEAVERQFCDLHPGKRLIAISREAGIQL